MSPDREQSPDGSHVVIVDAYAPVRALVAEFRDQGFRCVRVQSTPYVPFVYHAAAPVDDLFVANIVHSGDVAATLDAVASYHPVAVVPGGEVGVEFADLLSESLGLLTNGTALSAARRDKHTMVETIRRAGLRAAEQLRAYDEEELAAWHRKRGGRVVIKPLRSAGGDGVSFCDTPEQSVAAFRTLLAADDIFSCRNEGVVAQEYLAGTEYMVNTVSRDGRHHVCDVWRTTRLQANGMIDLADSLCLIGSDSQVVQPLSEYAFDVLDAVGIRHGPAHIEIRMTPTGPCLVEVGARLPGGGIATSARLGIGESQLEWTVDAYLRPERFHARAATPYQVKRFCAIVGMVSPVEGLLRGYQGIDKIASLESYHDMVVLVKPGQWLRRTVDDLGYPIVVTLLHELEEVVQTGLHTIRHLDGAGFYDIDPEGADSARRTDLAAAATAG